MNERIKLLAEQAGLKWKAQPPHYTNTNNPIDFPVSANRDLEKFAELIVQECADICYHHSNAAGGVDTHFGYGYKDCGDDIKRNFGVEL